MKAIKAYIKRHKLAEVTLALQKIDGLTGMSVHNMLGFGRGRARNAPDKITDHVVDFIPLVQIEIVCQDQLVETIVSTIAHTARTGLRGDGKIYVFPVENAIRISTGERGEPAA
ncbi:P-II family nitrogen regulator [Desulfobulbus sp.]|uniref:P-II family nitrogen regulator n=1 Tax=Desulfobulbus sp. TaxID=895 RepID=UPI00286F2486|nr:P-II family nitrogen regulator [Desulfobulbus sp.]